MHNTAAVVRRRLLGLLFFVIVIGFVAFTMLQYNKVFTPVVKVDLITDSAGNALPKNADVKVRGMLVGEVRSFEASGDQVHLHLAIKPEDAKLIPANATARLLPKTLFGERYVSLQIPESPKGTLSNGATIYQDKSGNAVELSQMFDNLLPILQAVPPQDLASTLGAINQALTGRGEKIGHALDQLNTIVGRFDDQLPDIKADLKGLATFSQTYSKAAPDLIDALDNLRTTSGTVVSKQNDIKALMASLTGTAASTSDLLQVNHDTIIQVAADLKDPLNVLAQASPAFGCTFKDFADVERKAKSIVGYGNKYPGIRVSIEIVNPRGRYIPNQDEPRLFDTRTAKCYRTAQPGEKYPIPDGTLNDGSYQPPTRHPDPNAPTLFPPNPQYSLVPQVGYAGSQAEQQTLAGIYGAATGTAPQDVPGWTTLMAAPALRGNEVTVK